MSAQKNNLPQILNVATIPSIENMNIKTEVLDPITITQTQAVFQIPKTGILDGGSMVQLGVLANPVNFFPLNTGIHGLIKSCFLKIGGKVLASNQDYAHYTTMMRQFETPEHRAYVDMVKSGAIGDRWSTNESGRLVYRDLVATNIGTATNTAISVPTFLRPTLDENTTPLFSVPLSTLIPMMRSRQLPLLALKEHVYLEINFNTQAANAPGTITCVNSGQGANSAVSVSTNNIKFISDHLYYTNEKMDNLVQQTMSQNGLSFLYEDIILTNANVPAVAGLAGVQEQPVERKIAVSGQTVRNIMVADKNEGENHNLLGQYVSRDLIIPSSYNFRINDQLIYDRNPKEPPRKYNELAQVLNKPLMVPSQLYSYDVDSDKTRADKRYNQNSIFLGLINGYQMPNSTNTDTTNDIRSTSHYNGYDATTTGFNVLGNGASVGVKPILFQKTYTRQPDQAGPPQVAGQNSARELRIFCGVEKAAVIKNGEITLTA
jgi:hypothetical protein